jgi:hypothetical protein
MAGLDASDLLSGGRSVVSGRDAGYQPRQDKPVPDIASAHKGRAMTDSEFQGLVFSWATDARNYSDEFLATERYNSTLYYRGHLPDVDLDAAQEDRSSAVMTEVRDTILGIMPDLLRIFFSADGVVKFNPVPTPDPELYVRRCKEADQATAYVQNVVLKVDNPDSFRTFYDAFQDAAVRKTGLIKWWWEKTRKPTYSAHTGLSEEQALALAADPEVEVIGKRAYLDPTFIPPESAIPPPMFRKSEVGFEDRASGEDHCAECTHFKPPGGCELVAGAIAPQSWCELYDRAPAQIPASAPASPIPAAVGMAGAGLASQQSGSGAVPEQPMASASGVAAPQGLAAAAPVGGSPVLPVNPGNSSPPMVYDLKIKRIKQQGRVRIRAVPCENIIVARRGVSVDRTSLFGMTEDKTVGDFLAEGLIDDPEELADCDMDPAHDGDNWETQARRPQIMSLQGPADNPAADPSMRIVKYGELYVTADRDGDGIPELIRVITGGIQYKILHEEPVDDIPFADFCPYPEAHQFFGESIADLTRDIQRIKSRILRDMLDSLAQSVTPQVGVVEGQVNLDDVLNPDTSRVIRMRQPGMVQPINMPFVGKEAMPVLDLMTQVRENRTGQSDASAGLDPAVLQSSTRAAVQATLTKAQSRVEMVARIFAETGMRRLFRGVLRETIKHCDEPRAVRLNGEVAVIDPRHWNAEMDVEPTLMLGRGSQQDQQQSLTDILAKQELILQTLGPDNPIVTLDQYSYTLRKLVELSGWRNATSFFNDMSQMDSQAKQQAIQQMTQQMAAKAGAGKSGPDPQIEQAKIASQEKQAQMKLQLEQMKEQNALALELLKIKGQYQIQLLQMQADHQQAIDQATVNGHMERFNAMLDAHVAHHGNVMANAAKIHIAGLNGKNGKNGNGASQ